MPIVITNLRTGEVTIVATAEEFEDTDSYDVQQVDEETAADMLDDTSVFNTRNDMKLDWID